MELVTKYFHELSVDELFEIYRLRNEVFIVEQQCVYQDVDVYDRESYHIFLKDEQGIEAYARVLPAHTTFATASIGRVIARKRRMGLGTRIVMESIRVAEQKFHCDEITIEAQVYARKMYENCGFVQTSEEFLEDGIPHIQMKYTKRKEA